MKKQRSKKYRIIQSARILSQIFFFTLFFYLLLRTHFPGEDYIGNVEIFFHFDPLLALTTIIASHTIFISFVFASITIVLTFLLGRVACGWVCPLGSMFQFFSFIFKKSKLLRPRKLENNNTAWKYYLFAFILFSSLFTLDLVGIFDPFSLLYRSFTIGLLPAVSHSFSSLIGVFYQINLPSLGDGLVQFFEILAVNSTFRQGFFIGVLFIGLILLNMSRERFWCRYICPLGAFLGIASRWNIIKLKIDPQKCTECNLCTIHCQTQADPFPNEKWKSSECVYCYTCSAICPTSAIGFPLGIEPAKIETVNLSRRKLIYFSLLGAFAVPFFRISPSVKRTSDKLIRPPGALSEEIFLQKCIKCGECMKACPTNALQPALSEAGPEGIWTPILVSKIGYCEYYCSLCSQVCPTGAIKELTVNEKIRVTIGTAWINKNTCIPYNLGTPCIVCEEHCPTSPKAIKFLKTEVKLPDETTKNPLAPIIDLETCIGCGICENKCPVVDAPAIYVTSVGEDRSEKNQLLLDIIQGEENLF
ncbi:4Fe-4S binding protein [Acidobacteriota bacterium]